MLWNPWDNFSFQWFSDTQCSGINDAINFLLQSFIHKSLPLIVIILLNQTNLNCIFSDEMDHFAVSSTDAGCFAWFPVQLIWIQPVIVFGTWKSNTVFNISQIPCRCRNGLIVLSKIWREDTNFQPKRNGFSVSSVKMIQLIDNDFGIEVNLLCVFYCYLIFVLIR